MFLLALLRHGLFGRSIVRQVRSFGGVFEQTRPRVIVLARQVGSGTSSFGNMILLFFVQRNDSRRVGGLLTSNDVRRSIIENHSQRTLSLDSRQEEVTGKNSVLRELTTMRIPACSRRSARRRRWPSRILLRRCHASPRLEIFPVHYGRLTARNAKSPIPIVFGTA